MADDRLEQALTALARRLSELAARDDDLRLELRELAESLVEALRPPPTPGPRPALTLGQPRPIEAAARPEPGADDWPEEGPDGDEPGAVEERCRLKAEAARWAGRRQRLLRGDVDFAAQIAPVDADLNRRAGELGGCDLWMIGPRAPVPNDPARFDELAGCFEAVAESLALARGAAGDRGATEKALALAAEAQSALRAAVERLGAAEDADQVAAYRWVRDEAGRLRVFLRRHLRADDTADPASASDLRARIAEAEARHQKADAHRAGLEALGRLVDPIAAGQADRADWPAIGAAVEALVAAGLPAGNRRLRERLLPLVDHLPEDLDPPPALLAAIRAMDQYLATHPAAEPAQPAREPSAEVREAARLLRGRALALIGGARRPEAQRQLQSALGLKELAWVETREHQPVASFEPVVARPDVAAVLLAIRWSSHAFGDVQHLCDRHGKPLVRLPGGYNPNQVAAQILAQCSGRLDA